MFYVLCMMPPIQNLLDVCHVYNAIRQWDHARIHNSENVMSSSCGHYVAVTQPQSTYSLVRQPRPLLLLLANLI